MITKKRDFWTLRNPPGSAFQEPDCFPEAAWSVPDIIFTDFGCILDYFYARARWSVFVEVPDEDKAPGMCGELHMSMYGTRNAANNEEQEYSDFLMLLGFAIGPTPPSLKVAFPRK